MIRKAWACTVAISFLMFVATVTFWARSYSRSYILSVRSLDPQSRLTGDRTLRVWKGAILYELGQLSGPVWQRPFVSTPHVEPNRVAYTSVRVSRYDYTHGFSSRLR